MIGSGRCTTIPRHYRRGRIAALSLPRLSLPLSLSLFSFFALLDVRRVYAADFSADRNWESRREGGNREDAKTARGSHDRSGDGGGGEVAAGMRGDG